jgi:hypothetical protein
VRQDSFVAGQPSGEFCYAMVPRDPTIGGYFAPPGWKKGTMRSAAIGTRYRLIAEGPGVTPLVQWDAAAFHSFDPVNPDDVVYDLRNLARVQALGANNHCLEGQSGIRARPLSSLRDDFHGGISSAKWNAPVTTGGATVTSGPSGLTFSLPAGSHSTAALASASGKLEPRASPVFVDLGPSGVPDGTSFDIRLFTTIGYQNGGTWNGLKVANGHLQVLRHYMYKGTPGHWLRTPEPRDEVALSVPYDSTSMRWLYLWIRGKEASVFTSPDSNTWHKVGGTDMTNWGLSPARLQFLVTGDGTVAASVSIATVSL